MLNKVKGSLIGGAVGDALGYAIEFYLEDGIFKKYGKQGISSYELTNGLAEISDDTQMTLFTAVGLLLGNDYISQINTAYLDWYHTQYNNDEKGVTWLYNVKELHSPRAPGGTCLTALSLGGNGTFEAPINDSKGCGGIMRVAPIGLYCKEDVCLLGAKVAALTHGHELGYIPAGMLSELISLILHNENVELKALVLKALENTKCIFGNKIHFPYFEKLILKAIKLSEKNKEDLKCIHELGEGWVAEETMAIAVYCALKYNNDFKKAIMVSVNHNGDSDSTGAVTGNILGAYLGYDEIPNEYKENLELKDVILKVAQDLLES